MTSGKLLDTNAVAALFNENGVLKTALAGTTLIIPAPVVGELYFDAYKSGHIKDNVQRLQGFLAQNKVLPCDAETGKWYGQIKQELKSKGSPIPGNDVWIAAVARQYHLTLVTRDGHFQRIADLSTESW
ncbi:MAG: type II toxin-antitoxin system VapC family toxin [Chloroflexi bacterium]|nr:type II toxin-antitoxin system VapC family toxin [Chloroflexota bacterium]